MALPLHGAYTCVLEKDPRADFVEFTGPTGVREFVGRVIAVNEVLQDGAGFENVDGSAVGEGV